MPPPPPPPPPPQVAQDDCAKKRTRRATAIERKSCVFMVRDYNYRLRQPSSASVCQEFVGNPPSPLGVYRPETWVTGIHRHRLCTKNEDWLSSAKRTRLKWTS